MGMTIKNVNGVVSKCRLCRTVAVVHTVRAMASLEAADLGGFASCNSRDCCRRSDRGVSQHQAIGLALDCSDDFSSTRRRVPRQRGGTTLPPSVGLRRVTLLSLAGAASVVIACGFGFGCDLASVRAPWRPTSTSHGILLPSGLAGAVCDGVGQLHLTGPTPVLPCREVDVRRRARSSQLDYLNPDAEWDPTWPKGKPPEDLKLPCTFEVQTRVFVHSEPSMDAPLIKGAMVRQGQTFSCVEIVKAGRVRGVDINFLKPKTAFFKESGAGGRGANPWSVGTDYCGEDGWICDTGIMKGPWYLRKLVKRARWFNAR